MSDPATQAAVESAAAAGIVVVVTGSVFGMDMQAIMAGFVGAMVAATFIPMQIKPDVALWQRYIMAVLQLVGAALLAGLLAPLVAPFVAKAVSGEVTVAHLQTGTAGLIGIAAPVIVPLIRRKVKKL